MEPETRTSNYNRQAYQKQYREAHKERKAELMKLLWEKNKEAINERRNQQFQCDVCGGKYTFKHKLDHEQSKKHKNVITTLI